MRMTSPIFFLMLIIVIVVSIQTGAATNKRTAAQVYGKYCVSCHGRDGRSKTTKAKFNHARDIADGNWQDQVTDERIYNSIMNGRNVRGNMPSFNKKITDEEADSLVSYVRQLRK